MATARIQPTGKHAVMAIDPGGTTGVGAVHVELKHMLHETLTEGITMRKTAEVTGTWLEQGKQLAEMIRRFLFVAQVEHSIPRQNCHVVFEDFVLRMPAVTSNLMSVWVAAAACAYADADGLEFQWQQPSDAKGLATNKRLKLWGLWVVGSEHKRDAMRHVALRVNRLLG